MFENFTYDFLMNRMLGQIPDTIDKRQGSVVFDMLSPSALELTELYQAIDMVLDEGFADTESYYYLLKRAAERNISPKEAAFAVWKGIFTPSDLEIPIGERFNHNDINFTIIGKIKDGEYQLQSEIEGAVGNSMGGELIPISNINGLETARLDELLIPGTEMEEEEEFRLKYFASLNSQPFGGNIAQYKKYCESISGVGAVKIDDAWNGGGTVRIVLLDSIYNIPSKELVEQIQSVIDPEENHGEGLGIAPIGHCVTAVSAKEMLVNVATVITYQEGYSFEQLHEKLEVELETYLLELRSQLKNNWDKNTQLIVRIAQIESRFLMIEGVQDITGTKINQLERNLALEEDYVPIRGTVNA